MGCSRQLKISTIGSKAPVSAGNQLGVRATDSRVVGDLLYLVSQHYLWYYSYRNRERHDKTQILSRRDDE